MKRLLDLGLALAVIAALLFPTPSLADDATQKRRNRAAEILDSIDDMWRGESSTGVSTMTVQTANYSRTMKMIMWSKGKEKSLIRILEPIKEKGTATLKSEDNIYTYLPKTDRTIKLTSGMMMGSWMGSHLTNDDLVKESRMSEDYFVEITFEGKRNGRDELEFTLIPKPDAAVVWGKIVVSTWVYREGMYLATEEIFYDEEMVESRRMTFEDIKEFDGRPLPARMKILPMDKPDEYTELVYESLEFNIKLDDDFFSLSRLRRR
jgi:hypothetical protein